MDESTSWRLGRKFIETISEKPMRFQVGDIVRISSNPITPHNGSVPSSENFPRNRNATITEMRDCGDEFSIRVRFDGQTGYCDFAEGELKLVRRQL